MLRDRDIGRRRPLQVCFCVAYTRSIAWHSTDADYHIYIDDTILKKNTDHNTTLLTHYASVHIDVALTIYADGKSIRAFILAIKIYTDTY